MSGTALLILSGTFSVGAVLAFIATERVMVPVTTSRAARLRIFAWALLLVAGAAVSVFKILGAAGMPALFIGGLIGCVASFSLSMARRELWRNSIQHTNGDNSWI